MLLTPTQTQAKTRCPFVLDSCCMVTQEMKINVCSDFFFIRSWQNSFVRCLPEWRKVTNPKLSKGPVWGLRLQAEEVGHAGQSVSPNAVKHHTGQSRRSQSILRFLQKTSYPNLKINRLKPDLQYILVYRLASETNCNVCLVTPHTVEKNWPVGLRTNLHNPPGASLFSFLHLIVDDQFTRLKCTQNHDH